jgi:2-alkenal reductase
MAQNGENMNKKVVLSVVVVLLTATLMACQLSGLVPTTTAPTPTTSTALPVAQAVNLVDQQDRLISLYQAVRPGVVTIQTSNALGSGWVYSSDGYIVTNQHVVEAETKVEVDFPTGYKTYGTVVGADPNSDLAVIKVDVPAEQLHPLALGDSDALQIGQIAVAIGDPLTLNGTMTTGIISGLGRSEDSNAQSIGGAYFAAGDFIETDALLNHGNSGGPLLNLDGQVIGVNRSIQIDPNTGASSGLGYAISVNVVKRVIPELIQKGKFDYPYLGVSTLDNLPLKVIDELGLKSTTGAYVTSVVPGGPADQAGILAGTQPSTITNLNSGGDLIIAVDGQPVQVFADMIRYLVLHKSPGNTVTLTVLRGDQKVDATVTLGARP